MHINSNWSDGKGIPKTHLQKAVPVQYSIGPPMAGTTFLGDILVSQLFGAPATV
jgi:hypothetical protein